jgi:hypothetical protein
MKLKELIENLFPKDPEVGDVWILDDGDPFFALEARILDVKDGWVKYVNGRDGFYSASPSTSAIPRFKRIYRLLRKQDIS